MIVKDTLTYNYQTSRKTDLSVLVENIKAYGLPPRWRMNVAGSSVVVTSPDRRQVVKADIYHTVDIDIRRGLAVKSERQRCPNLEATWDATRKALNTFLKRS